MALALAAVPLFGLTDLALRRRRLAGRSVAGEAYRLPPAPILRGLAFGYHELAADAVWLRTIAYFGDHLTSDRDLIHLKRYLETTVALDPHFKPVYRYGAAMLTSLGDETTSNAQVLAAIRLLERAQRTFPNDYRFPLRLGTAYMSELRTSDPEQRRRWRRRGADYVQRAAMIGADIPWLPTLAAKIYSETGQRELAIRHLQEVYLVTKDSEMRRQIAAKLRSMRAAQAADSIEQEARRIARSLRRSRLPFLSPDFYALVELPRWRPFSLERAARKGVDLTPHTPARIRRRGEHPQRQRNDAPPSRGGAR